MKRSWTSICLFIDPDFGVKLHGIHYIVQHHYGTGHHCHYWHPAWATLTIKNLLLPAIILCAIVTIHFPEPIARVILLQAAMPTFTLASVIPAYRSASGSGEHAVMTIVFSTVAAMLTIPLVMWAGIAFIS